MACAKAADVRSPGASLHGYAVLPLAAVTLGKCLDRLRSPGALVRLACDWTAPCCSDFFSCVLPGSSARVRGALPQNLAIHAYRTTL